MVTAAIALLSGIAGVVATLAAVRVQWRKDSRDDTAATLAMKDERIEELEQKVRRLQSDVDALAAKVRSLEARLNQYGCWSAPHCKDWKPLAGPNPHGTI